MKRVSNIGEESKHPKRCRRIEDTVSIKQRYASTVSLNYSLTFTAIEIEINTSENHCSVDTALQWQQ